MALFNLLFICVGVDKHSITDINVIKIINNIMKFPYLVTLEALELGLNNKSLPESN